MQKVLIISVCFQRWLNSFKNAINQRNPLIHVFGRIRGVSLRRTQKEDRLIVEASGFGPYLGIPIASEGVEGHTTTTVFCQLILSRILKHLQSLGFTHLVGFFGSSEQLCANQGTTIAYHCDLNLQTNLLFFREKDAENFSLTSFDIYPR
jgi:hypothetical protein